MKELNLEAKLDNISTLTQNVSSYLEDIGSSVKAQMQIDVAIDEIFSNISFYAYGEKGGNVTVRMDFEPDTRLFLLQFIDSGIPFNPLEKQDPDITLSANDREIGGLGIYMVKKTMDDVTYEYTDNKNVLTIKKSV